VISCRHPMWKSQGLVLKHLQHFKSHVQTVHRVNLWEQRIMYSNNRC
jgi:hypothetical protein